MTDTMTQDEYNADFDAKLQSPPEWLSEESKSIFIEMSAMCFDKTDFDPNFSFWLCDVLISMHHEETERISA